MEVEAVEVGVVMWRVDVMTKTEMIEEIDPAILLVVWI